MIKGMDLQPMVKSILFLYFRISFNLTDMYKLQLGIYGRSKVQKLLEIRGRMKEVYLGGRKWGVLSSLLYPRASPGVGQPPH